MSLDFLEISTFEMYVEILGFIEVFGDTPYLFVILYSVENLKNMFQEKKMVIYTFSEFCQYT